MELTPVESSHVAAFGYLEADQVLIVRYKDGALYAVPRFTPSMWAALEVAQSKGAWLRGLVGGSQIQKGGACAAAIAPAAVVDTAPLNVVTETQISRCCLRGLHSLWRNCKRLDDPWVCAVCGTKFISQMDGVMRQWRVDPFVAVLR